MTDDHRLTSGRYGDPPRALPRDDLAGVLYTLVPLGDADTAPPLGHVPEDALDAAQSHCRALAAAYPHEPIAALAETVADQLQRAPGHPAPGRHLLYAAALLCHEQAAHTATVADLNPGSAQLTYLHLEAAADDATRASVQQALAEQPRHGGYRAAHPCTTPPPAAGDPARAARYVQGNGQHRRRPGREGRRDHRGPGRGHCAGTGTRARRRPQTPPRCSRTTRAQPQPRST